MRPFTRRGTWLALLLLVAAPGAALAQRDVGPARVALFGGARLANPTAAVLGVGGELELQRVWTLAAVASLTDVRDGSYARYELDGRWRPAGDGRLRPYLGAGVVVTGSSVVSAGGPTRWRLGALALAGAETPLFGLHLFAEVVGVQTDSFTAEVRGGVRLLVLGQ